MSIKEELIRVLYQQVDIIQQLVEVMYEKQRAVVNMQYDMLRSHLTMEEELAVKLRRLEERRLHLLMDLTGKSAKEVQEYSISDLISDASQQEVGTLKSIQRQYKSLLKKLKSVTETNQVLIDHSRRFVEKLIKIMTANNERPLVDHRA